MNPVPPFVGNSDDDMHCVNAVYRMLLKHYFHEDVTWEAIDRITKATPGKGTWTVLGDIWLANKGLTVTNIEPVDYAELYRKGTGYLADVFGQQTSDYYLNRSNIAEIIPDIPEFLRVVRHETRRVTIGEITSLVKTGHLVAATVNSAVLNNTQGFALHLVLLYDCNGTHFTLHDPGLPPLPSRMITTEEFQNCFYYPGGNGGIDVFSR